MIRYSVQCSHDHVWQDWYDNSAEYDRKAQGGEIACPECGDTAVRKAIMAPNIGKSAAAAPAAAPSCGAGPGGMGGMGGGCGGCAFGG